MISFHLSEQITDLEERKKTLQSQLYDIFASLSAIYRPHPFKLWPPPRSRLFETNNKKDWRISWGLKIKMKHWWKFVCSKNLGCIAFTSCTRRFPCEVNQQDYICYCFFLWPMQFPRLWLKISHWKLYLSLLRCPIARPEKFACFSNWPIFPPYSLDAGEPFFQILSSFNSSLMSNFTGPDLTHLLKHFNLFNSFMAGHWFGTNWQEFRENT